MKYSFHERLERHRVMLFNAKNTSAIAKRMATFGFNGNKMLKGIAMLDDVLEAQSQKDTQYGAQKSATDALNTEWYTFKKTYNEHVALARIAYREDSGAYSTLNLDETRQATMGAWLTQATSFYQQLTAYADGMARFGVSAEDIQTAQAQIQALKNLRDTQLQRKGAAQDATDQRNQAMEALDEWMNEFRQIARIAMKDNPQLLETLGIVVKA